MCSLMGSIVVPLNAKFSNPRFLQFCNKKSEERKSAWEQKSTWEQKSSWDQKSGEQKSACEQKSGNKSPSDIKCPETKVRGTKVLQPLLLIHF